jgi:hypothetical protein
VKVGAHPAVQNLAPGNPLHLVHALMFVSSLLAAPRVV